MSEQEEGTSQGAKLGLPSWILLLTVALVPVAFATGFSQFETAKEAVLTGGIGLALVVWGAMVVMGRRTTLVAGRVVTLGLAFGLYVILALAWSSFPLYGAVGASQMAALAGAVLLISAPIGRGIGLTDLASAIAAGTATAAIFGLLDLAGMGFMTIVWDPPGPTGVFDAMEFAVPYYAVALPVIISAVFFEEGRARLLFGVAALLGAAHFGLMMDWTFLSIFVVACALAAAAILIYEGTETFTVLAPISAMVGLVILVKIVAGQFAPAPTETNDATSLPVIQAASGPLFDGEAIRNPAFATGRMESVRTLEEREYLVGLAFDLFQDQPLLGHGPDAWWKLQTKYPNSDHPAVQGRFNRYPAYRSPHNSWSKLLVEYGGIGFGLAALWFIGCIAIALGALGRSGEHSDLITEQWGLWASLLAGIGFATVTPLVELAPAALTWVVVIGLLTRRSAQVNEYKGASMRWTIGGDETGTGARMAAGTTPAVIAVGIIAVMSVQTVSQLHRGWGDQLMLRTYLHRAIDQYKKADSWMPVHGDVVYNMGLAYKRLGVLGQIARQDGKPGGDKPADKESTDAKQEESAKAKKGEEPKKMTPTEVRLKSGGLGLVKRAVDLRPYDSRSLEMLASYYIQSSMPKEALRYARRAISANPNNVAAHKTLATVFRVSGKMDQAKSQLVEIIERDPPPENLFRLHMQLGRLYAAIKEPHNAKEQYELARKYAPKASAKQKADKKLKEIEKKIEMRRRKMEGKPPKGAEEKVPGPLKKHKGHQH